MLTVFICFISCENDLERVKTFSDKKNTPVRQGFGVEIAYTDSGILKGKILTPELQVYNTDDGGYVEFPKGLKVIFLNDSGVQTSYITSNYAINYPKKQLWIARNKVVAVNEAEHKELYTRLSVPGNRSRDPHHT